MQITGMLHGARLLRFVGFPATEVLGPGASEEEIKTLIDRHGQVFIKPVFKGGIGKKGKAGLLGRASDLKTALAEKERLYFVEHVVGNQRAKANGVTFEAGVPAKHEVYFSISDSTRFRAPTMTLTHHGGMDIEEVDKSHIAQVPFDPLTGLKAFVVANALSEIGAPKEIISPLVQQLPKLWELFHDFGMTTLELNPIRMREDGKGRITPVACDFKCGFDRDDSRWARLGLPPHLFAADYSDFEQEINQLRTHQGQSDVYVINERGTILAPTFGGGANSLVTEMLGDAAIISSDFGGNPPYEKMKEVARICFKHWLRQANVLFVIGGKSNNTDIFETLRAIADALREHFSAHGADAAVRGARARRAEPGARHGRDARHLRAARAAVSAVRLRFRHQPGDRLREGGRCLDERWRPRRGGGKARPEASGGLRRGRTMNKQGIGDFKYFVGIGSLAHVATREDRVCVLNILGGESSDVTPVSHAYSGGNVVFGTAPGRGGQVLTTPVGDIPVFNNVREGLQAGHRFNCGVVYLPPSAARDGVAELIRVNPELTQGLHHHREDLGARRARDPRDGPAGRRGHLRRQRPGRGRLVEQRAHRRRARRRLRRATRSSPARSRSSPTPAASRPRSRSTCA